MHAGFARGHDQRDSGEHGECGFRLRGQQRLHEHQRVGDVNVEFLLGRPREFVQWRICVVNGCAPVVSRIAGCLRCLVLAKQCN